jgi:hypothetical protein
LALRKSLNANDLIFQTVEDGLDEMHRNPDWGINEAILSCQNRYKYLIALLKTNPEQLCGSDFFPQPEVEVNTTLLVRLTLSKGCDPWRWEEGTGFHVGSRQAGPQSLPSSRGFWSINSWDLMHLFYGPNG